MKYYATGSAGPRDRQVGAELEAADPMAAAGAFALANPDVHVIHVWSSLASATAGARRVHGVVNPLATFHVNRDPGAPEGVFRIHRVNG